jgi:hypothetical protein
MQTNIFLFFDPTFVIFADSLKVREKRMKFSVNIVLEEVPGSANADSFKIIDIPVG